MFGPLKSPQAASGRHLPSRHRAEATLGTVHFRLPRQMARFPTGWNLAARQSDCAPSSQQLQRSPRTVPPNATTFYSGCQAVRFPPRSESGQVVRRPADWQPEADIQRFGARASNPPRTPARQNSQLAPTLPGRRARTRVESSNPQIDSAASCTLRLKRSEFERRARVSDRPNCCRSMQPPSRRCSGFLHTSPKVASIFVISAPGSLPSSRSTRAADLRWL